MNIHSFAVKAMDLFLMPKARDLQVAGRTGERFPSFSILHPAIFVLRGSAEVVF